jgi:hypothetical protein
MIDSSRFERIVVDRYRFRGFHGCASWCKLEILRLSDGRSAVIATELMDNPGTSITNAAEHLAYRVCVEFSIDPSRLVWIEHYGYPSAFEKGNPRSFDLVTFRIPPAGHDAVFADPTWRPMSDEDWRSLGLPPRAPVEYRA